MSWELPLLLGAHLLLAVYWVGGMFFAYVCLRPAAGGLAAADRVALWDRVFARFLPGVWVAAIGLPLTGYRMGSLLYGGVAGYPAFVHIMQGLAWLMIALFLVFRFGPRRRLHRAIADGDTAAAGQALGRGRWLIAANLTLGIALIAVVGAGRYLGS